MMLFYGYSCRCGSGFLFLSVSEPFLDFAVKRYVAAAGAAHVMSDIEIQLAPDHCHIGNRDEQFTERGAFIDHLVKVRRKWSS